jgi:hypothetical protein
MKQPSKKSRRTGDTMVAAPPDARRTATPSDSVGTPKSIHALKTKADRVAELRKLVGPGRRISAVLRRANGRFVIYTEPDAPDVTGDKANSTPMT